MLFVCPACKGPLAEPGDSFSCTRCARLFPIVAGIPDFRLAPDPYIGIEDDRAKGLRLREASRSRTFDALVRYYYSITPDHPADLAERRVRHARAEVDIARTLLSEAGLLTRSPHRGALLDTGCSTGALLVAAADAFDTLIGVDVAFRWLILGQGRLREAGVHATLVCANAESLPFPDGAADAITATDLLEHVRDAPVAVREAHRVLSDAGITLWTTNNRFAPVAEPHVHLWGVGYVPRRWQRRFVAWRRSDLRSYEVCLRSRSEIRRLFRAAGFSAAAIEAAPLVGTGHQLHFVRVALQTFNRIRRWPVVAAFLEHIGPRLAIRAVKSHG
jgi:ubiquinone/menaquinone biosynthesis C-methylase UbiE/uncharacterized protein YbaR (Trm112 family)